MTISQRLLLLSTVCLVGCSLATDFGRFDVPSGDRGDLGDGGGGTGGREDGGDGPTMDGGNGGDGGNGNGLDGNVLPDAAAVDGQVTASLVGNGLGVITSEPVGIDCGADCSQVFDVGATVTLRATPDADSMFKAWGGDCAGQVGPVCTLTTGAPLFVSAEFTHDWFDVAVLRSGNGSGVVSSSDGAMNCDGTPTQVCSRRYLKGASVTLSAIASQNGSSFSGWGGACAGTGDCALVVNATMMVNAVFDPENEVSLIVSKAGNGSGTVVSDTGGIACGNICAGSFPKPMGGTNPTTVVLTASAAANSDFVGFTGCDSTSGSICTVAMDAVQGVTAEFALKRFFLNVVWNGQGAGGITATNPAGLTCTKPNDCKQLYEYGTKVSLTAAPGAGSTFVAWSGGGCGSGPVCEVTVTDATFLVANFALSSYPLTAGAVGVGTVLCNDGSCPAQYLHGTNVTFSVEPGTGWELMAWGGDCAGSSAAGDCQLTISKATSVIATFRKRQYAVGVTITGTGTVGGTVPCASGTCTLQLEHGTALTLEAMAGANHNFAGWGGDCGGTGTCEKTITGPLSITAPFTPVVVGQASLSVSKNGKGTVASETPDGRLSCGTTCSGASAQFAAGSNVTLNASPATGYAFGSFSGCTATAPGKCQATLVADINPVVVTFIPNSYAVNVSNNGTGAGSVTATGITCGNGGTDCSENRPFDSVLTLTATPSATSTFIGWGGDCAGVSSTCDLTIDDTTGMTVTATFALKTYQVQVTKTGGFNSTNTNTNTVSRTPSGSACGTQPLDPDCGVYNHGSNLTLSATAGTGSTFVRWVGGPCNNSTVKDCAVNGLNSDQSITAQFGVAQYAVSTAVTGPGIVTSGESAPLIRCGAGNTACSANYAHGTSVTLTAAKVNNGRFLSWGGACAGTQAQCIVPVTQVTNVTATFVPTYALTVELIGTGVGGLAPQVTGSGISCARSGGVCTVLLDQGAKVNLGPSSPKWARFSGFSANCPPIADMRCEFAIQQNTTVQAEFEALGALVFVTSDLLPGSFGGTEQADKHCGLLAKDQQLPGPWVAWVSDATSQPRGGLKGSTGRLTQITSDTPLVRIDGAWIAERGLAQTAAGPLNAPILLDEKGFAHTKDNDVAVWTGTLPSGVRNGDDAPYCEGWDSKVGVITEGWGTTTATDDTWTVRDGRGGIILPGVGFACSGVAHLYCVRDIAVTR